MSSSSKKAQDSLYPSINMNELAENLFPDTEEDSRNIPIQDSSEQILITIPSAIVHLIDKDQSVELASGEFSVIQLTQGPNIVAALARIGDQIQWPLAKDEAAVKLDDSHYFFALRVPSEKDENQASDSCLNYGVTFATKGQEGKLEELDSILEKYSAFKVEEVAGKGGVVAVKEVGPEEMEVKKEEMERSASAYWTTIAPNVEDYSSGLARMIAAGSGQVVRGILWCGDVTVDRLKWGNDFLSKRMGKGGKSEVSPQTLARLKRVKDMTKRSEQVAKGILSGVVKVSGFFTSPIVNSKVGHKFFSLLPGEIILASLDGFNKVFDAVEVAGTNVMSTTSVVTTGLVSQKYGEDAGKATQDGFGAAGHAFGTAWTVFKIRKSLNPKGVFKPSSLAKAAAKASSAQLKSKSMK